METIPFENDSITERLSARSWFPHRRERSASAQHIVWQTFIVISLARLGNFNQQQMEPNGERFPSQRRKKTEFSPPSAI